MRLKLTCLTCLLLSFGSTSSLAQSAYPDIREFAAETALSFPGDPAFTLSEGGAVEFWVSPDWTSQPDRDPVILANFGEENYNYILSVERDKSGLIFQVGDKAAALPFDFTDGQLHHVAIVPLADNTLAIIDGEVVGNFDLQVTEAPSSEFWIGNSIYQDAPFTGAMGGLRIWSVAPQIEDLVGFALEDVRMSERVHSSLEFLDVQSEFQDGSLQILRDEEPAEDLNLDGDIE